MLHRTVVLLIVFGAITSIVYRWCTASFPVLGRHRGKVAAVFTAVLGSLLFTRSILRHSPSGLLEPVLLVLSDSAMAMVIAAPWILLWQGLVRLSERLRREKAPSPSSALPTVTSEDATMTRRQLAEAAGGSIILAATSGTLAWGTLRGRADFRIETLEVRIPGLPRTLDGYTIAQVSDLHGGPFMGPEELAYGLSFARTMRPDLLVATGDLVDFESRFAPSVARALSDARGRDGVAVILGNHDYYAGYSEVIQAMTAERVPVLMNGGLRIREEDRGGFALLGVVDAAATRFSGVVPDLDAALRSVAPDAPRILLSHQPPTIREFGFAGRVALQLSGHTHGGQINPGFTPARLVLRYLEGRYEVGGTTLYVNRGFGTAGPPSRVGAPPEITKIVLVSA